MNQSKARLFCAAMMTEHQQVQYQLATTLGRPRARDRYNRMVDLLRVGEGMELISTDVFDTLLLRSFGSERSRIIEGERLFSNLLAKQGKNIDPDFLVEGRLQSQRLAFRSLNLSGSVGEVSLLDIIASTIELCLVCRLRWSSSDYGSKCRWKSARFSPTRNSRMFCENFAALVRVSLR